MKPSWPLGVDILEWKKAEAFYRRHGKKLTLLFHQDEIDYVRRAQKPSKAFASVFAAKEAVFKCLGASWMGSTGFKDIHIFPKKNFAFRLSGRMKKMLPAKTTMKITLQENTRHVIATCHPAVVSLCVGT